MFPSARAQRPTRLLRRPTWLAARRACGAPLVSPPGAVGRPAGAGAGRGRVVVLAGAHGRHRRAELHDADGGARQPDADRHGQRHAAADALDQHRQRTLGHGAARSTSTSTTRSRRARCWSSSTPPSCATRSCARAPRWPRPTPRSRRPPRRSRRHGPAWRGSRKWRACRAARCRPRPSSTAAARRSSARDRRRGERARQRQRRAGGAVDRRDQPVEGLDHARPPTAWC